MSDGVSGIRLQWMKITFGLKARMSIYERVEAFLDAGIDIVSTLKAIRDRYNKKSKTKSKALIMDNWIKQMEKGQNFSDAIQAWVPTSEHMLIAAGERGEGLISGLQEARVLSVAASKSKAAIMGGTIFPAVLFSAIIGMLIMFKKQMVPIFESLMPVDRWPGSGQTLYTISSFLSDQLIFVLLTIAGISFLIGSTMGKWKGDIRVKYFDRIPPWSIYRSYQASSFLIAMSSLMKAGVPAYDSLKIMYRTASPWMKDHLEKMMRRMRAGGDQGEAMDTGLLEDEAAGDIQDYSRLGSFQDAIYRIGRRSMEDGVKSIQMKMDMFRNLMLVAVASSIAWIYMTTYSLQSTIADSVNRSP